MLYFEYVVVCVVTAVVTFIIGWVCHMLYKNKKPEITANLETDTSESPKDDPERWIRIIQEKRKVIAARRAAGKSEGDTKRVSIENIQPKDEKDGPEVQ